jgi:hypothetical protein
MNVNFGILCHRVVKSRQTLGLFLLHVENFSTLISKEIKIFFEHVYLKNLMSIRETKLNLTAETYKPKIKVRLLSFSFKKLSK